LTAGRWIALAWCGRVLLATLPGYVHPDEAFQSAEVVGAVLLGTHAAVPWEFASCDTPNRSILPPLLSTGLPYALLRAAGVRSGWLLLLLPRWWLACLAAVAGERWRRLMPPFQRLPPSTPPPPLVDCMLADTLTRLRLDPSLGLAFAATSWATGLMGVRPFSNSLEALALTALAWVAVRLVQVRGGGGGVGERACQSFRRRLLVTCVIVPARACAPPTPSAAAGHPLSRLRLPCAPATPSALRPLASILA
jgi:hypothetical protein